LISKNNPYTKQPFSFLFFFLGAFFCLKKGRSSDNIKKIQAELDYEAEIETD
jgi:hypothetical protein